MKYHEEVISTLFLWMGEIWTIYTRGMENSILIFIYEERILSHMHYI